MLLLLLLLLLLRYRFLFLPCFFGFIRWLLNKKKNTQTNKNRLPTPISGRQAAPRREPSGGPKGRLCARAFVFGLLCFAFMFCAAVLLLQF